MILNRSEFLLRLTEASVAVAKKPGIEGAQSFHFRGDSLTTFNGEMLARVKNPLDFDVVVSASDALEALGKIPDEEVEVVKTEGELEFYSIRVNPKTEKRMRGRRAAGISASAISEIPLDGVPKPGEYSPIGEGALMAIRAAAAVCSDDPEMSLATCVHVSQDRVEGCDNARLLRTEIPTGFPEEALIPAEAVRKTKELEFTKVSITGGWVHLRTSVGSQISICCMGGEYPDVGAMLKLREPSKVILPRELADILKRAELPSDEDKKVTLTIADGKITTRSSRGGFWFQETSRCKYEGTPLKFTVDPEILRDAIRQTRIVQVDSDKMKLVVGNTKFVVCLENADAPASSESAESEESES